MWRLRRIENEEVALERHVVHAGAGSEVVGVLLAAMQHHHQRQRLPMVARRYV